MNQATNTQNNIPVTEDMKSNNLLYLLLDTVLIVLISTVYKSPLVFMELLPIIDNVSSGAIL